MFENIFIYRIKKTLSQIYINIFLLIFNHLTFRYYKINILKKYSFFGWNTCKIQLILKISNSSCRVADVSNNMPPVMAKILLLFLTVKVNCMSNDCKFATVQRILFTESLTNINSFSKNHVVHGAERNFSRKIRGFFR